MPLSSARTIAQTNSRVKSQMGFAGTVHCKTNSFPFVLGVTCTTYTTAYSHNAIELCPLTSTSVSGCPRRRSRSDPAADNASDSRNANTIHNMEYAAQKDKGRMQNAHYAHNTGGQRWLRLWLKRDNRVTVGNIICYQKLYSNWNSFSKSIESIIV